jgi:hypothetical protein
MLSTYVMERVLALPRADREELAAVLLDSLRSDGHEPEEVIDLDTTVQVDESDLEVTQPTER